MSRASARERGVGSIEFLLVAPLVFLAILGVLQVILVTIAKSEVQDAALAAAHASRNGHDPSSAADRAAGNSVSSVSVHRGNGPNTWTVDAKVRKVLPGIPDFTVTKTAVLP